MFDPFNDGNTGIPADLGAHTVKFSDMHETVRKNPVSDDADPGVMAIKAIYWACKSVGKPGCGWVTILAGRKVFLTFNTYIRPIFVHINPDRLQFINQRQ